MHCLKPGEIQFVKDFYKVKFNSQRNKRLQLFELILKNQARNNQEACQKIYHHKADSAFCHLKKRLEEDLLNFILLASPSRSDQDQSSKEEIQCGKTLLQSKILLSRGVQDQGISLLQKTSKLADKYEFPGHKLAAFDILRKYQGIKPGLKTRKYYSDHINKAFDTFRKILKAKEVKYATQESNNQNNFDSKKFKKNKLELMSNQYDPAGSKRAYFWYEMAIIEHYFGEHNFQAAKSFTMHLIKYIKSEPVLDSSAKKAEVYLKLAESYIQLGEYDRAVNPANKALSLYTAGQREYLGALRVLFFANFRNGDFNDAGHVVNLATNHEHQTSQFSQKWLLYQAALKFSMGEHREVGKKLNCVRQLNRADTAWCMGHRLLELLNILELQDYDWFEYKIESFRKKLFSVKSGICSRLPKIYVLLKTLVSTNYHYHEAAEIQRDTLVVLQDCPWNPMGYELIKVDQWLICKACNTATTG